MTGYRTGRSAQLSAERRIMFDVHYSRIQFAGFFNLLRERQPERTPGVQIVVNPRHQRLMVIYNDGCFTDAHKDQLLAIVNEYEARLRGDSPRPSLDEFAPEQGFMLPGKTKQQIRQRNYRRR